jgi:NAD(P)-dependent dehydrogenase (short-subunit alcohol dehydrogenase family)
MKKIVLVTGAQGGIGSSICKRLKEEDYIVIGTGRSSDYNKDLYDDWLLLDVTSEGNWNFVAKYIDSKYNKLDALVNNAGISVVKKVEDTTSEDWHNSISVNATGVFLGTKYCLPLLKKSNDANIVNISSVAGLVGAEFNAAYCASKGAVTLFTKACALEFSALGYNIRVNSIHPGGVNTEMLEEIFQSFKVISNLSSSSVAREATIATHPLGRLAEPKEIANAVKFIISEEASYIHGSELVIDGGYIAR